MKHKAFIESNLEKLVPIFLNLPVGNWLVITKTRGRTMQGRRYIAKKLKDIADLMQIDVEVDLWGTEIKIRKVDKDALVNFINTYKQTVMNQPGKIPMAQEMLIRALSKHYKT